MIKPHSLGWLRPSTLLKSCSTKMTFGMRDPPFSTNSNILVCFSQCVPEVSRYSQYEVRHKLKNFLDEKEGVSGFLPFEEFKTLVEYDKTRWPTPEEPHKRLTAKGDDVIRVYTQVQFSISSCDDLCREKIGTAPELTCYWQ